MKKITAILLLLAVCFGLFGCGQDKSPAAATTQPTEYTGYRVAQPMQYPDYTFDHEPTTDELRQMAVKAMADELSVEWCVDRYFKYNKTISGSVQITVNEDSDLYLDGNTNSIATVLVEDLEKDARIGIFMLRPGTFLTGITNELLECFFSNHDDYDVTFEDGKLTLN